jgi:hypothetical protein
VTDMQWSLFPGGPIECSGLPWLEENLPDTWRLPRPSVSSLPVGVQREMRFPAGAMLRLYSDTSRLHLRIRCTPGHPAAGLDVYVNNQFWRTASVPAEGDVVCFAGASRSQKEIAVFLPLRHELQVVAYGTDIDAVCRKPKSFARDRPFVLYGSSVAQGIGSSRPGMSYAGILGRSMNIDHVNLGFGGAGKAEPDVVALVAQIDACCYLLDLGKSYGRQSAAAYTAMLVALRQAHPDTPLVCITPIFSSRELHTQDYGDLSDHTRAVVRESVAERLARGDRLIFLVEGETLLSSRDSDGLAGDGLHPNDLGHSLIAERLRPRIEQALQSTSAEERCG